MRRPGSPLLFALLLVAPSIRAGEFPPEVEHAASLVEPRAIESHVRFLADDLLEGRDTGSRGHEIAALYVANRMLAAGLEPAGEDGWLQPVPLRSARLTSATMSVHSGDGSWRDLEPREEFVAFANPEFPHAEAEGRLVFAGFGITAPELGWDDYAGIDVRGKIAVIFRNAPDRFSSSYRAHYASTREKRRNAAAHGARGIIEISTPSEEARTPWSSVSRYPDHPTMRWIEPGGSVHDGSPGLVAHARVSPASAGVLFESAAVPLSKLIEKAEAGERMRSFVLPGSVRIRAESDLADLSSPNVAGVLPGSDPELRGESLVLVAHLDHVGVREADDSGDRIHNGAYDNATGVATLLEVARVLASLEQRPRRSVVFLAVTAEEKGLLGADYFAHHPTPAAGRPVAAISLDMFLMLFPLHDLIAYGAEHSSLGEDVEKVARALGVAISPDPVPEQVLFVRTDHYPFVRRGVPALYLDHGHLSGDPDVDGAALVQQWMDEVYHEAGDDLTQDFDWEAGADFARFIVMLSWEIASDPEAPRWNEGDFFGETFGSGR